MKTFLRIAAPLALILVLAQVFAWAQGSSSPPSRRAKRPSFQGADPAGVYFRDVFAEGLIGERPANLSAPQALAGGPSGGGSDGGGSGDGVYAWSKIISPVSIENEIKALKLRLDKDVTTPTKFKSGGFKLTRRHCSIAAAMFAIVGEYDGKVRWHEEAPAVRDVFARTARNASTATDQVYNEAKQRRQDLGDLVAGSAFSAPNKPERKANWEEVCDRSPLMQRIESAQQGALQPLTSNQNDFKSNKEKIIHEAEIIAATAEILKQDGMTDSSDSDYVEYCDRMLKAARQIVDAAQSENYDQASQAVGEITKSCSECHESYRG